MAATGHAQPGFRPSKKARVFMMEELPINCLDGCRCSDEERPKRHKMVNVCGCRNGHRCASHSLRDCLTRVYGARA